jgi:(R,R)-butanediol dehydrogenase / meso-butanediol dehydrogenase / diacetyl reductase
MRAGLIRGKGRFELAEVASPTPGEGEAVVDISRCGICGSDVHAYAEGWAYAPGLCGHEWVGTVREVGSGVTTVTEGDRVAGAVLPACGVCDECRAGLSTYCALGRATYSGRLAPTNGGFAPSLAIHAGRLCRLPASLTDVQGAIVEPASVAFHGVRRSHFRVGDVVAVVGCGPIGLLTVQCLRLAGAGHVIAVEPDAARRERAVAVGAHAAHAPGPELRAHIDEVTRGLRVDVAYDCAGVPQTLQQSVDLVRRGGAVTMIGVAGGEATVVPMRWLGKEISVNAAMAFTMEEMDTVAGLVADGRIAAEALHDGTVTLDELGATIEDLAHRRLDAVKILVDPTGG